jgi:hypothetical protein
MLPDASTVVTLTPDATRAEWTARHAALVHVLHGDAAAARALRTTADVIANGDLHSPEYCLQALESIYRAASAEFWYLFLAPEDELHAFAQAYERRGVEELGRIMAAADSLLGADPARTITHYLADALDALHPYKGLLPAPTPTQRKAK